MRTLYNKARNEQYDESDVCMSIIARFGTGGNNMPVVLEDEMFFALQAFGDYKETEAASALKMRDYKDATDLVTQEVTGPLMASGYQKLGTQEAMNGMYVVEKKDEVLPFDTTQVTSPMNWSQPKAGDPCHPLAATAHHPAIVDGRGGEAVGVRHDGVAQTLDANYFKGAGERNGEEREVLAVDCRNASEDEVNGTLQNAAYKSLNANAVCRSENIVRRLTPLECERLQGFPDGWTNLGEWTDSKGKKHKDADSPRYKALGNSIALPFWKVLARRIAAQYDRDITMGSLFDGIGGFPLAFQHCGATPVWASEIEEFPIAVTKRRFGEG